MVLRYVRLSEFGLFWDELGFVRLVGKMVDCVGLSYV